jgi:hypothetical protein
MILTHVFRKNTLTLENSGKEDRERVDVCWTRVSPSTKYISLFSLDNGEGGVK